MLMSCRADVQMAEGPVSEPAIKQDSATPAPGSTSDNPLDAPDGPPPETTLPRDDEDMAEGDATVEGEDGQPRDEDNVGGLSEAKTKEAIENLAREHLISQTHAIVLPSYSTWFDMQP